MDNKSKTDAADISDFDLERYILNYQSHAKLDRLIFISEKCSNTNLELEALKHATNILKKSMDTERYKKIVEKIKGRLGDEYKLDKEWVERTENRAEHLQTELDIQLQGCKASLGKEAIRIAYTDIANFYYDRGQLQESFKHYLKTRDYCMNSKHTFNMCLNVMKVALEMRGYTHITNYLKKAELLPEDTRSNLMNAKLACMGGLRELENKNYDIAAMKFVSVDPDIGLKYNDVITPQDIAIYGGLCALASFSRSELKMKVIDNIAFREFLELIPEIRDCVYDFYKSQYASCFSNLKMLKKYLIIDMHLHGHIDVLYQKIKEKALIQYTIPFASVKMQPMAEAFDISVDELEKELVRLIINKQINVKIDSQNKLLYAKNTNNRKNTLKETFKLSELYIRETKALLLRTNLMKHDLMQKQIIKQGKRAHVPEGQQQQQQQQSNVVPPNTSTNGI